MRQADRDRPAGYASAGKAGARGPERSWRGEPLTAATVRSVVGQQHAALAFVEKCVRDLPRVPELRPAARRFWPTREQAHAAGVRLFVTARHLLRAREALAGGRAGGRATIVTHTRPDVDALAAAWLAERFLLAGRPAEVLFKRYTFDWTRGPAADCIVDLGGLSDPAAGLFDHKPPARADRTETCATRLLWEHLTARGLPVGGELAGLVDAVLGGDSPAGRAGSAAYRESRARGVHGEYHRLAAEGLADAELYAGVRAWLDRRFRGCLPAG